MKMEYMKVDDIPCIYNYLALYGAIMSKESITADEALKRVGILKETASYKEFRQEPTLPKTVVKESEKRKRNKGGKSAKYIYFAYDISNNLLCKGKVREVAEKLKVVESTVRVAATTGSKLKGYVSITREEVDYEC